MDIKETVIMCCREIIEKSRGNIEVDMDTAISRDKGIDSLGIVNLVLELEDKFGVELDNYLADIRKCETIRDLVDVMTGIVEKK
ncbi:MAG: acyl carrier protein [Lachnospiraceae bacterium]|nr:acyl carrier protein [Lachnospiraceae bacterium]